MVGIVEKYLMNKIKEDGTIHITLVDPEKVTTATAKKMVGEAESCQTSAIMVGGSTVVSTQHLDRIVKTIKKAVPLPVILFPNNITGISKYADAIWFMSLLNSSDPYFLVGAQVLGAPTIKKFNLEPIPLGYIIVGESSAVSVVGRAVPIPYNKPELAVAHALTAEYFGMRFVYLEAGSGAKNPVPCKMITAVKKAINLPLIIGGGIKSGEQAKEIALSGANIIVTGTLLEGNNIKGKVLEVINTLRHSGIE
jgi:phosphoglycerol geranylgeranyltransferase